MFEDVGVEDMTGRHFINKVPIPSAYSAFSSPDRMFSSTKKNEVVEAKAKAEDNKSTASMAPTEPPSGCIMM